MSTRSGIGRNTAGKGQGLTVQQARLLPVLAGPQLPCTPVMQLFDMGHPPTVERQMRNLCVRCPRNHDCIRRMAVR